MNPTEPFPPPPPQARPAAPTVLEMPPIPLASLRPPSLAEQEAAAGVRARHFLAFNGVGMQRSQTRFEVLHDCGGWTWAHQPFCGQCGGRLELRADHAALLAQHAHRQDSPRAAVRPFAAADPDPGEEPSPAHAPRPDDAPPGSFHNPLWARRGPTPGNPALVRPSPAAGRPLQAPAAAPPAPAAAPPPPRPRTASGAVVAVPRPAGA